jgi:phage shock protein A
MNASTLSSPRRGSLGRLRNLCAGWLSLWVRDREHQHPRAVYEQAIQGRLKRYAELKEAVAGILYLRNKLEGEIRERRTEMARLSGDAERAVKRGDESLAVAVVTHRHELMGGLERADQHASRFLPCHNVARAIERGLGRYPEDPAKFATALSVCL